MSIHDEQNYTFYHNAMVNAEKEASRPVSPDYSEIAPKKKISTNLKNQLKRQQKSL
jgi:hypothetical protein